VAGNRTLYSRLLRQFRDAYADAAEQIRQSLARGDRAAAERLAHTVKGTAGNLGAVPVQEAAGAVEKAMREGGEAGALERLRARLAEALDRLGAALRPMLAEPAPESPARDGDGAAPAAPAPDADAPALHGVAERWSRLLEESDAASVAGLEREAPALRALLGGAEPFARFAELVSAYDFEGALAALRRAARPER
jgi:two-component system sensor histidine kinase/response regulator